jgi:hypothetical protein
METVTSLCTIKLNLTQLNNTAPLSNSTYRKLSRVVENTSFHFRKFFLALSLWIMPPYVILPLALTACQHCHPIYPLPGNSSALKCSTCAWKENLIAKKKGRRPQVDPHLLLADQ